MDSNKEPTEKGEASNKDVITGKQAQEKEDQPQISKKGKEAMEEPTKDHKQGVSFTPPLPYPQRFNKETKDQHFYKFLEVFKRLEINIPLAEALDQMPLYVKFLKDLINKKRSWHEKETILLTEEGKALIQKGLPPKLEDPGSFFLPCTIGRLSINKAMCDLGANFVVLDSDKDEGDSIILGRPFLATARAIIDVEQGELTLRMHDESITLNVFPGTQFRDEKKNCIEIDKEDLQWKEGTSKEITDYFPRQEINNIVRQKENETVQGEEGNQEEIEVLTTEKKNPKVKPIVKEEGSTKRRKKSKKKTQKGWENKKIPTEGFSKGDEV
ncbi:uncharacterized protein LOC107620531 [Arachis ipaensis]|uniref:uncharacterized protein LOC107620531 n=1 Tax=Arachis ipaensis TaxID=130454 RepID=UPI0007AEFD1E|nr:uncharacterized protein LOC107620531 [Arachis ipaensis]XP_025684999.1 uncharacterized protein LOC112785783 [Arachis hypogaea]